MIYPHGKASNGIGSDSTFAVSCQQNIAPIKLAVPSLERFALHAD
jgi:hypothetical protein